MHTSFTGIYLLVVNGIKVSLKIEDIGSIINLNSYQSGLQWAELSEGGSQELTCHQRPLWVLQVPHHSLLDPDYRHPAP